MNDCASTRLISLQPLYIIHINFKHHNLYNMHTEHAGNSDHNSHSAPSKKVLFWISAVKTRFSLSNQNKIIKELLWRGFLKICFSPYIANREVIEVQNKSFGKYYCQNLRKGTVSQNMYGVKISNLT